MPAPSASCIATVLIQQGCSAHSLDPDHLAFAASECILHGRAINLFGKVKARIVWQTDIAVLDQPLRPQSTQRFFQFDFTNLLIIKDELFPR